MTKIKTAGTFFFWFLKRPPLYKEFGRLIFSKISNVFCSKVDTRQASEEWCKARALDSVQAIKKITNQPTIVPLREKFPAVFTKAEEVARNCHEKMGGAGELDLLFSLAEYAKAVRVIETGVAYGWSSLAILLSISSRENAQLISTDMPYPGRNNDQFVGCVVPENLRANWNLIRLPDKDGLPLALNKLGNIDFCHYDSDKRYNSRMWAYPLLWNALRRGGIFISDDIGDNVAFKDFCEKIKQTPLIVRSPSSHGYKYIGILIKMTSEN